MSGKTRIWNNVEGKKLFWEVTTLQTKYKDLVTFVQNYMYMSKPYMAGVVQHVM